MLALRLPVVLWLCCAAVACSNDRAGRGGGGAGGGGVGGVAGGAAAGGQGAQGGENAGAGQGDGDQGEEGEGEVGGEDQGGGQGGGEGEGEGEAGDEGEARDDGEAGEAGDEGGEAGPEGGGDVGGEEGGEVESGAIQVLPGFVDFGDVQVGEQGRRFVTVTNVGLGDLRVQGLELRIHDAGEFDVELAPDSPADALPAVIEPEGFLELAVTFTPNGEGRASAELSLQSDDPVLPEVVVDLQGAGVEDAPAGLCVRVDPESINWGQVPVGATQAREVAIVNCGDEPIRLRGGGLTDDSSPAFSFHGDGELPRDVDVGEVWRTSVQYAPALAGADAGVLQIQRDPADLFVELSGRGVEEGALVCSAEFRVGRGAWVRLDGGLVHAGIGETVNMRLPAAAGQELAPRWELAGRPDGSRARILPDVDEREVRFEPDLLGEYDVAVELTREDGESTDCAGSVRALPERDIVVQVAWDTPGDPDQQDEGFGAGADVDIHFLRAGGAWNCHPGDCFYANATPDWGELGDPADDPSLDIDDTDGLDPEQISLSRPEEGGVYDVGVHYFNDHGFGPSTVTVRVFIRGDLHWESPPTRMAATDNWWNPARIHWPEARVEVLDGGVADLPPRDECP